MAGKNPDSLTIVAMSVIFLKTLEERKFEKDWRKVTETLGGVQMHHNAMEKQEGK